MNYLVVECRPAYAVVLGEDGTFLKVANFRYAVGETVTDVVPLHLPEPVGDTAGRRSKRRISSFAALAACVMLMVTAAFHTVQKPVASVYMTINPEVRIDVNRMDRVVAVEGINPDGAQLLTGYDHRRKELDTVMDELVDRAVEQGYLHEGGKITLDLDGDARWVGSHEQHLTDHLSSHLTDRITVTIDVGPKEPPAPPSMEPIVIPVKPEIHGNSDHGDDSLYGDDGDSDYGGDPLYGDDGDSPYEAASDSLYEDSAGEDDREDGQTDYGHGAEVSGDSPYEDFAEEPSDDGEADDDNDDNDDNDDEDDGDSEYSDSDYGET